MSNCRHALSVRRTCNDNKRNYKWRQSENANANECTRFQVNELERLETEHVPRPRAATSVAMRITRVRVRNSKREQNRLFDGCNSWRFGTVSIPSRPMTFRSLETTVHLIKLCPLTPVRHSFTRADKLAHLAAHDRVLADVCLREWETQDSQVV